MATWNNVETNRPQSDLTTTVVNDCTFESETATGLLPDTFDAENFNETDFIYSLFGFQNTGSGSSSWALNGFNYGILGSIRAGVGFFYFYSVVPPYSSDERVTGDEQCQEDDFQRVNFWDYISTFWNFLDDDSREMVENYWYGLVMAGGSLYKKGSRFLTAVAPQNTNVCVFEDYYDLQVSPLLSRPLYLDATSKSPKSIINPIGTVLVEPTYSDSEPIYRDLIEITADDYYKIRHMGVRSTKIDSECYVVVQPKNQQIDKKYFRVTDFLSSEEPYDRVASAIIGGENSGAIKIVSLNNDDVSQYKVTISASATGHAAEITWTVDSLSIVVDTGSSDQIADILTPFSETGTPWAALTNASPYGYDNAPLMSDIDFEDLDLYISSQNANGRYYQDSGKVWKWYDGYPVGSEQPGDDTTHGEWVESKSKFKYMIEIDGSLAYLGAEAFSIYMTTGKSYDIDRSVMDLPYLSTGIEIDGIYFRKDTDFIFNDYVVEFLTDIFVNKGVEIDDTLYCKKTPIIEQYLFEQHGGMVGVSDWTEYKYKNISGKAAINTLLSSLRDPNSIDAYQKAMNAYYGLPVSPEKSRVVGLFESYGYKVIAMSGDVATVELGSEEIHAFVQHGGIMLNSAGKQFIITGINRSAGTLVLSGDTDEISYGDRLCIKLSNKFKIKNIYSGEPAYIDVYIREGYKPVKHVIDTVFGMYGKYPELIIHGTDNHNGLYHITNAETHPDGYPSVVRLTLYSPGAYEEPMYNDYIGTTIESESGGAFNNDNIFIGYAHMPWPTHKFLYLYMIDSARFYRAYLDSPIDTVYDTSDVLEQYQVICRNASVFNGTMFNTWNQYRNFRRAPGINVETDIIETIFADPSAKFGQYFPSGYVALE